MTPIPRALLRLLSPCAAHDYSELALGPLGYQTYRCRRCGRACDCGACAATREIEGEGG